MDPRVMRNEAVDRSKRRLLGGAAATLTAARLGLLSMPASAAGSAPLKSVKAGVLEVAYADTGPASGPPVILLHGWPYDIHAFDEVAPILAAQGHRVIVPHLRGYGPTRFLSAETMRNGQPAALAKDAIALMDTLKIESALLGGFDWGART